eukprot:RCo017997
MNVLQPCYVHEAGAVLPERLNNLRVQRSQIGHRLVVLQVNLRDEEEPRLQCRQYPALLGNDVNAVLVACPHSQAVRAEHAGVVHIPQVVHNVIGHAPRGIARGKGVQHSDRVQVSYLEVIDGLDVGATQPHLVKNMALNRLGQVGDHELDQPLLRASLLPCLQHPLRGLVQQHRGGKEEPHLLPALGAVGAPVPHLIDFQEEDVLAVFSNEGLHCLMGGHALRVTGVLPVVGVLQQHGLQELQAGRGKWGLEDRVRSSCAKVLLHELLRLQRPEHGEQGLEALLIVYKLSQQLKGGVSPIQFASEVGAVHGDPGVLPQHRGQGPAHLHGRLVGPWDSLQTTGQLLRGKLAGLRGGCAAQQLEDPPRELFQELCTDV